jgi:predicted PurR-regulated permease PerM
MMTDESAPPTKTEVSEVIMPAGAPVQIAVPHTVDPAGMLRSALWIGVVIAGLWFLTRIHFTLVVFGLAWLIAYLMNPVVEAMEHSRLGPIKHCPRGLAICAIYLFLAAVTLLLGSLMFPVITGQVNRLIELKQSFYDPQQLANLLQQRAIKLSGLVPAQYRAEVLDKVRTSLGAVSTEGAKLVGIGLARFAEFFGQLLAGALVFISAALISIYVLAGWSGLGYATISSVPERYQEDARALLAEMNRIFGGYLRATILTSLTCAVCTFLVLEAFGMISGKGCPYALVISLIAGVTYPVPLFGILFSTAVAAVLAFLPESDIGTALWVGCLALTVNGIIDRTLLPKLMSEAIGVSPLFVLFAAAAGEEFLGGIVGMLLGIPMAAICKVLFSWFKFRFLTDPSKRNVAAPPTLPPLEPLPDLVSGQAAVE